MSLTSSPDLFSRPEDKVLKMLFPAIEEPSNNSFDEFLDGDLFCQSDDSGDQDILGDSNDVFVNDYYPISDDRDLAVQLAKPQAGSPTQPWRKGLWCLNGKSPSQLVVNKTRSSNNQHNSNISPAHLSNNDNYAVRSPTKSKMNNHYQATPSRSSVTREATLSPSPVYTRISPYKQRGQVETWQEDFQNFHLYKSDEARNSAPVENHVQIQRVLPMQKASHLSRNPAPAHSSPYGHAPGHEFTHRPNNHHRVRDGNEIIDPSLVVVEPDIPLSPPDRKPQYPLHEEERRCEVTEWTTESLHSSDSSHTSHESYQSSYHSIPPQTWWSPVTGHGTQHPGIEPKGFQPAIIAPAPQRAAHQILQHHHEQYGGLEIQYPALDEIGTAVSYYPSETNYTQIATSMVPAHPPQVVNAFAVYPPLPPPLPHGYVEAPTLSTPKSRAKSMSRSPSPNASPTVETSRSLRQRSPTRTDHSHHRRKSIHKPGPIKGNVPEVTSRSRSSSKPPRTPKTPKTPTGGFGQIDFVNFTPKDATKLLSDVAPSGSSKTRARREQEAREKRKRLSEAAFQAVRMAGGDVAALEEAILI